MAKVTDHNHSRLKSTLQTFGILITVVIVGCGFWFGSREYLSRKSDAKIAEATKECPANTPTTNHLWLISGNEFQPTSMSIPRCDTVTVLNKDDRTRYIAFGEHDSHIEYDGLDEQILHASQSFDFVAIEIGTFKIHDHLDDHVESLLVVYEKN